ncbi:hypothetical protein CHELA1G11_20210 [Hyphomicrobiales bacterium]|nr:hypothetical protein CHELA1G11_20210 [Hyphomicrobiales bacterium]CAH1689126.1 hypothetical protein CHELA1G2_20526 [Hyphomicrobiales bacterium]
MSLARVVFLLHPAPVGTRANPIARALDCVHHDKAVQDNPKVVIGNWQEA